eukprot:gene8127-8791_t
MKVTQLPQVILSTIKDFLVINNLSLYDIDRIRLDGGFDAINWLEGQDGWKHFLSCCKGENGYWKNIIRKELMDYRLNHYYSQKYLTNPLYREKVLSCLHDPYLQLSLDFSHNGFVSLKNEDSAILSNLRRLNLSRSHDLQDLPDNLSHIYELSLDRCANIKEITNIHDIKILHVNHCHDLKTIIGLHDLQELRISHCRDFESITPLPKQLKKLTYTRKPELDKQFSQLQELEELFIDSYDRDTRNSITMTVPWFLPHLKRLDSNDVFLDIPTLQSLPNLKIVHWERPRNKLFSKEVIDNHVKAFLSSDFLSKLEEFDFQVSSKPFKEQLFPVRNYEGVKDMTVCGIPNPAGFESLSKLKKVSVMLSSEFTDANIFQHGSLVVLNSCPKVTDVSSLGKVRELMIDDCQNLTSLQGLGERTLRLHLLRCQGITDVSMLGNIKRLVLDFSYNIEDITAISHIPYLSLRGCFKIKDFSGLGQPNQKYLNLTGCDLTNNDLYRLANIPTLIISYCNEISDISMLRNDRLTARHCSNLTEAKLQHNFIKADFSYSSSLQRIVILNDIYALSILATAIDISSLIILGSVKYITTEFEYPNYLESAAIEDADAPIYDQDGEYDDHHEEDNNEVGENQDEDEWEDVDEDEENENDDNGDY